MAGRSSVPSALRNLLPNSWITACSPGLPGSTTSREMRSVSITGMPRALNISATTDFPLAMPPVRPMRSKLSFGLNVVTRIFAIIVVSLAASLHYLAVTLCNQINLPEDSFDPITVKISAPARKHPWQCGVPNAAAIKQHLAENMCFLKVSADYRCLQRRRYMPV